MDDMDEVDNMDIPQNADLTRSCAAVHNVHKVHKVHFPAPRYRLRAMRCAAGTRGPWPKGALLWGKEGFPPCSLCLAFTSGSRAC